MRFGNFKTDPQNGEPMAVRYYIVCVIDVLGQSQELQKWKHLPTTAEEEAVFKSGLKKTRGTIDGLRDGIEEYFKSFVADPSSLQPVDAIERERFEISRRWSDVEFHLVQFSDTFLIYSPLANPHGDLNIRTLLGFLGACAMIMAIGLAGKVALRGALCVGTGLKVPGESHDQFYGPALAEAHYLESKVAQYPRIVVSSDILDLIYPKVDTSTVPLVNIAHRNYLNSCRSLVTKDGDGLYIVDFLGEFMRENLQASAEGDWRRVISSLEEFVDGQFEFFQKQGNLVLGPRFGRLKTYIESRITNWNVATHTVGD